MFNKKFLILFIAAICVLLCLTHIPQDKMPEDLGMFNFDKLLHMVAYFGLTLLLFLAVRPGRGASFWLPAFALLLVLGAVDEYTQSFVGRSASTADWLADVIGIILAALLIRIISTISSNQNSPHLTPKT